MNLAMRDMRHNALRFVLTGLGLGGLLGHRGCDGGHLRGCAR